MKIRTTVILTLATVLISACGDDCTIQPSLEVTGTYRGTFTYRPYNVEIPEIHEDHLLIVSSNVDHKNMLNVSTEGISRIIMLRGIVDDGDGRLSGEVYLYNSSSHIGIAGEEIAGNGSFQYQEGSFAMIWTASEINGEWMLSFDGER